MLRAPAEDSTGSISGADGGMRCSCSIISTGTSSRKTLHAWFWHLAAAAAADNGSISTLFINQQ
jgi:hypothetical protein